MRVWVGGAARESFGKKEEGSKEDGVERREGEYHPPTQTLKSQEWRLRVCVRGKGHERRLGKRRREKRRTGRKKRTRLTPTRPETKEPRLEMCSPAATSLDISMTFKKELPC